MSSKLNPVTSLTRPQVYAVSPIALLPRWWLLAVQGQYAPREGGYQVNQTTSYGGCMLPDEFGGALRPDRGGDDAGHDANESGQGGSRQNGAPRHVGQERRRTN